MAPLPTVTSRALAQAAGRTCAVRAISTTAARPVSRPGEPPVPSHPGEPSSTYESPFKVPYVPYKVPDFSKYMVKSPTKTQMFSYFMVGALGAISAAGAKSTVQGKLPFRWQVQWWTLTGFWRVERGSGSGPSGVNGFRSMRKLGSVSDTRGLQWLTSDLISCVQNS